MSDDETYREWYAKGLASEECPPGSDEPWPGDYDHVALKGWSEGVWMRQSIERPDPDRSKAKIDMVNLRQSLKEGKA